MIVTSKYNSITTYQDKLLVFNSYSGQLASASRNSDVSSFLSGQSRTLSNETQVLLKQYHFAVEPDTDEDRLAQMKLFDYIYDSSLELLIMPTMQCNFRCTYCYENFDCGLITDMAVDSIIKYLRLNLNKYSGLSIAWFGGEPLLALPQMERISQEAIRICSSLKIPYSSSIVTNGWLLTPDVMNRLMKMRIYRLQITVDGIPGIHDKTRKLKNGSGTFQTIFHNLQAVRDSINSPALLVFIRCNVTKSSLGFLSSFMELMSKNFGGDPRFQFYFQPVEDWGGNSVTNIKDDLLHSPESFYHALTSTIARYPLHSGNSFKQLNGLAACSSVKKNYYIITPELDIKKCTVELNSPINGIGKLAGGRLILDQEKVAYWSFQELSVHSTCKRSCALYANCFTRLCPAKTFGKEMAGCPSKRGNILHELCVEYQIAPEKFISL